MTTETPKRIQRSRLTHVNFYKLVQWLKNNPDIVRTMTKRALAEKASQELGFSVDWSSMSDLARELNIEIGLPKVINQSKKEKFKNFTLQEEVMKSLIREILINRKWIEVLLKKTFKNQEESNAAFKELFGSPDSIILRSEPVQAPSQ